MKIVRDENFNSIVINGILYKISTKENENDDEKQVRLVSEEAYITPAVSDIIYDDTTQTFRIIDYLDVLGRKVKIMFNINLDFEIVGLIYNDFENGYESITPNTFENSKFMLDIYVNYRVKLYDRLCKIIKKREEKFENINKSMVELSRKRTK